MPYVDAESRERLDAGGFPATAGELNYSITKLLNEYLERRGTPRYADWNEVIGALECAKLEIYRRSIAPYEDRKMRENGDVYGFTE